MLFCNRLAISFEVLKWLVDVDLLIGQYVVCRGWRDFGFVINGERAIARLVFVLCIGYGAGDV